jgi:hypothetical protein
MSMFMFIVMNMFTCIFIDMDKDILTNLDRARDRNMGMDTDQM